MLEMISDIAPSGREERLISKIADFARDYSDHIETDAMGNLIVKMGKGGKKIMLSAHVDHVGIAALSADKEGFVRFGAVGGLAPCDLAGARVKFQNGVLGVIRYEEKSDKAKRKTEDFFIDIGAADKEAAAELIDIPSYAGFDYPAYVQGDHIISPYLDNKLGVLALLTTMKNLTDLENQVYFAFTVQEELGCRGAKTAAFGIEPDYAIVVDVTDSGDTPGFDGYMDVKLGAGPAIKVMDRSAIISAKAIGFLKETANRHDIPYQLEVLNAGGTESGVIQTSRGGCLVSAVSIPTRYIHTPSEMCHINDVKGAIELVGHAVREWK